MRCEPYFCQCQLWSPVVLAWVLAPLKSIEQYLARSSTLNIFSQARPKPCLCEDPSVCDCSSVGLALVSSCMFADVFLLVNPAISEISYTAIIPYCKRTFLRLSSAQSRTIFKNMRNYQSCQRVCLVSSIAVAARGNFDFGTAPPNPMVNHVVASPAIAAVLFCQVLALLQPRVEAALLA